MKSSLITLVGLGLMCTQVYAAEYQTSSSPSTTETTNQASMQMQSQSPAEKNKMDGNAFLAANKSKPGVVTLPDGLQYKIITEGKGAQPTANDIVTVHYSGTLIDGTEFDSSYKRGEPTSFPVNGVIPGWVEALQLMKVGSTWELFIPSNLAYGEQGMPPVIGPNQTLIFKVTLLDVKKA